MEDLRRRHPQATTAPYRPRGAYFWRFVFVPLYRRVPWGQGEGHAGAADDGRFQWLDAALTAPRRAVAPAAAASAIAAHDGAERPGRGLVDHAAVGALGAQA